MAALALLLALALATLSRILFVHYSGQWLLCLEATAPKAKECEAQFQSKMAQALPWTSLHIEQTDVSPRQIQSQVTLKYNSEFKFIKALNFSEQLKLHRAQVYGKKDWKWYTQ
ncbi:MAG: hypothetical protein CL677_06780 [Bdellovibrionaceae bacterium]|nr:hypothetical protein [Pseudobdellovibrionaceae bacterium]